MRARYPDRDGYVERDGVKVFYEVFGSDHVTTILLMPTWSIIHSRHWKAQIPYLARRYRVITFDGRGNGRSDRPASTDAYADVEFVADALEVMDSTGTERAVVAGLSMGAGYALRLAAEHPERVLGCVFIGPTVGLADPIPDRVTYPFNERLPTEEGWAKYNAHYWRKDWRGFAEFFFGEMFCEPHSTKQIEDCVRWAMETDAETMLAGDGAPYLGAPATARRRPTERPFALDLAAAVRCPSLVIHGRDDRITHVSGGRRLAEGVGGSLVVLAGSGHSPQARDPVVVNLLIARFMASLHEPTTRGG